MPPANRSNHEKAPVCAAFVRNLRELFGPCTVLYVNEGEVQLGEKQPEGTPCVHDGKGVRFPYPQENKKAA